MDKTIKVSIESRKPLPGYRIECGETTIILDPRCCSGPLAVETLGTYLAEELGLDWNLFEAQKDCPRDADEARKFIENL